MSDDKPLGIKAYGSIAHIPGSRMGPGDHTCSPGQARIACDKARDRHDQIYVQEKLDGSCTSVAKIAGEIVPLGRAGYRAVSSQYEQHRLFHEWAMTNRSRFDALLEEGERAVGEWLAQAHGTRYDLTGKEPWVLFDIMKGHERRTVEDVFVRNDLYGGFALPWILAEEPTSAERAMELLGPYGHYGAIDRCEGVVYRVERDGKVDFLVKYVRPDKVDGLFLEEHTGFGPVWNWRP
jgi:RNA ligase